MKRPTKGSGKVEGKIMNTQELMRDNPVVTQGSQKTIYQSDINLSVLNETSPFKLSEIHADMTEEELQLRQQLAIMEAKRGAKASQPLFVNYAMMQQSANQTIPIWNVSPTKSTNPFLSRHASGDFLIPLKGDDMKKMESTGKISITTHAVTVTKVEYATAENLLTLKLELEEGRQKVTMT